MPAGVAFGASDHYTYASWVAQARHGILLMSDLYATEPHAAAFFNPYFIACGWIARATGYQPATVLSLLGLVAGPVLAVVVYMTCRLLRFSHLVRVLAAALVLFGTGPSVALKLLNALSSLAGLHVHIPLGIDCSYFDLFPGMTLLTAPYQAVSNALAAIVLFLALTWQRAAHAGVRRHWQTLGVGIALAGLVLVRPYQCAGLAICLPATILFDLLTGRRGRQDALADFAVLAAATGPAIFYVGWLSQLDVWHSMSRAHSLIHVSRASILIAYSLFWALSALGIGRAVSERRSDLSLLAIWTLETMIALPLFGNDALKFADASPIAMSILGAYGLEPWLTSASGRRAFAFPQVRRSAAILSIVLLAFTTFSNYYAILTGGLPAIDGEAVAASVFIDRRPAAGTPTVLTDCVSGNIMPGVTPVRVYAGNFALTPDYFQKCENIDMAGFSMAAVPGASEAAFQNLVAGVSPDYVFAKKGGLADGWARDRTDMSLVWQASRWDLYLVRKKPVAF